MCKGIPAFTLKWRVVFLWAVRGITSLQKAHLHEHDYEKKGEGRAWGIVPHYGFVALGATRHALLPAPGQEQVFNRLPATGQLQAAY